MSYNGDNTNDGLSLDHPVQTIQRGIDIADSTGDIVHIASGTYKGEGNINVNFRGVDIIVQGSGVDEVVIDCEGDRGLVIDHGEYPTIEKGAGEKRKNLACIITNPILSGETTATIVEHITITNCSSTHGAAILIGGNAKPILRNLHISHCKSTFGGGIMISLGDPVLDQIEMDHCVAAEGGAIQVSLGGATMSRLHVHDSVAQIGGAMSLSGSVSIENSTIVENYAADEGGAIYGAMLHLTIVNSSFVKNIGYDGAAIRMVRTDWIIRNSYFKGNVALDSGSAIRAKQHLTSTFVSLLEDTIFEENKSDDGKGCIYLDDFNLTIRRGVFRNNIADNGAAVYVSDQSYAIMIDTIMTDNIASKGGAMHIKESGGECFGCVLSRNKADNAGGLLLEVSIIGKIGIFMCKFPSYFITTMETILVIINFFFILELNVFFIFFNLFRKLLSSAKTVYLIPMRPQKL